jgi:YggT family protein
MDSYNSPTTQPIFRASQIVWYVLGVIEALLVFRFFLKLLAANPDAGFSSFIYQLSYPLVAPFLAVFNITEVLGSIIEWTTVLALIVYWLFAMGIMQLLMMSKTVSTPEAARILKQQEEV